MPAIDTAALTGPQWSISESVTKSLPKGFMRYFWAIGVLGIFSGYLECLGQLTLVGEISRESFLDRLSYMQRHHDTYMPIVIADDSNWIVGCGTLFIERKFIHDCGMLAHIEDIVVANEQRGKGLGKLVIEQLKHMAFHYGCYKITLDCDPKNEPFYAKTEFEAKGLQMCIYYRDDPATTPASPKYPYLHQK